MNKNNKILRGLHIYAVNGKQNSGDFFLGPATKYSMEEKLGQQIAWNDFDVRIEVSEDDIKYFNQYDFLVVGGGGLFLPDTNPNKNSCWQWSINKSLVRKITADIYFHSVGWNHFYGQNITMPHRDSDYSDKHREKIFKENIEEFLDITKEFSMRHRGDVEQIRKIVDPSYHSKISFEFCPVIKYVKDKFSKKILSEGVYHTFEIKDDRPHRRYYKKDRQVFYTELIEFIRNLIKDGERIAVMSHDGSSSFYHFLLSKNIPVVLLNNTVANQEFIISNYSKVKKLYCTAGHSQMTAHALGIDYYSLISHDKLKFFLQDNGNFSQNNYCMINEENINEKIVL